MTILETKELKKYYDSGEYITKALDGVSLEIEEGEFVAIVGASGSGKSTLLNMIGGLDIPTSGSVLVKGKKIGQLNEEELTVFRRRNIGFVFQNYNLIPTLNVYENIVFPVELDGNDIDKDFLNKIVTILGIDKKYADLTFGGGGHSRRILERLGPAGRLYAFDQDRDTLANRPDDGRFCYVESNFRFLRGALRKIGDCKFCIL